MSFFKKSLLESWKFAVYLTIPFFAVYVIAQPHNMKQLLEYKQYVVYPPEGPRPPVGTREEIKKRSKEILADHKAKQQQQQQAEA